MSTVGMVKRDPKTGAYTGNLKTLSVSAAIEITPVKKKVAPNGPDFMITCRGIEVGAAWKRKGERSGKEYVSCSFTAPEFGNALYANLGKMAGQDDPDVFALIHNAQTRKS